MPKSGEEHYCGYKFLSDLCLGAWDLVTASRQKIGMVLTFMTLTLSAATVIGMAFDRDLNPLQRYNNESCALQASFGLISVGSGIQFLLFFFLLYQFFKARHNKHRVDEYHLNVSANALSTMALVAGMTLYVTMLTSTMDFWYYFLGWDSVAFAIFNTLLWFVTQYYHRHAERYITHRRLREDSTSEDDSS